MQDLITVCETSRRFGGFVTLFWKSLVRSHTITMKQGLTNIRVPTLHCFTPVCLDQVNVRSATNSTTKLQGDSFGTRPKKMRISQRLFIRFWTCLYDYTPCFMRSMSILVWRSLTSWRHIQWIRCVLLHNYLLKYLLTYLLTYLLHTAQSFIRS